MTLPARRESQGAERASDADDQILLCARLLSAERGSARLKQASLRTGGALAGPPVFGLQGHHRLRCGSPTGLVGTAPESPRWLALRRPRIPDRGSRARLRRCPPQRRQSVATIRKTCVRRRPRRPCAASAVVRPERRAATIECPLPS